MPNNNYILTSEGNFMSINELYHHGVKGMRWGVRKKSYESEKSDYKQAKKDFKTARRDLRRASWTAAGRKGLKKYNAKENAYNKAELDMITAKAKYKAAKSKNAQKAEFNTYRKEMQKTGLVGSAADRASGGRSERIYNQLKVSKGKKYADAVEKKVQNRAVASLATSAVVAVGVSIASAYMSEKYR